MLVGRQAEQQAIERMMAAARLGTSGVLAVCGEAGVGKTALLDDAVGKRTGLRLLRATGIESESGVPFGTLLQLLRPALGALDAISPVQADALAAALALPRKSTDASPDRFTIGAAVLSLLCRYAEDGPIAVVVDDLQLADMPSADALVFAARRLAADPVVMLFGVRQPEGELIAAGLPSTTLKGLDLGSARMLVERARGLNESEENFRLLHRATDGNPLALLELGRADRDVVERLETGLPLRVPRALVDAFGRRLAALPDNVQHALLMAAVCGTDVRLFTDAWAAAGVDPGGLSDAEDLGLVTVRAGVIEFRHPVLRAAVYSRAPVEQRRAAHRVAAAVTSAADIDRRAWHLSEAVWFPDSDVADLLAQAGDRAVSRAGYSVASTAFQRSAHLTSDPDGRCYRLYQAADSAWMAGEADRALALLDEREKEVPPGSAETPVIGLRASIAARTGSLRTALDLLLASSDRTTSPDDATVALADAVHVTYYLGDARTAAALADRLGDLRAKLTDPRARALGLMATGIARILAGRGGADDIRRAVPLLETEPSLRSDARRLSWLLLAPLFLRDAAGGARLRELVDEVRGAAGVGALPAVLFHVARDQATTDAWARGEANYTEAVRLAAETGQATELAMSLAGLCALDSRAGRADACRDHGSDARVLCAARDIHVGEAWVAFALGDLELSLGQAGLAAEHLSGLVALLEQLGLDDADLSPAPELTDALLRLGRRDEAREVAARFADRAEKKGQPWAMARADRALGAAAADDEFDDRFAAALALHDQTLDRFETARTNLAYGERLRRVGRRVDARTPLRAALDEFRHLGAVIWTDRATAELAATGEHVHKTQTTGVEQLTPQELQVGLLLADGRTTREAAAALFLSPKTVEYHLRKVYLKLGIASRGELGKLLSPGLI